MKPSRLITLGALALAAALPASGRQWTEWTLGTSMLPLLPAERTRIVLRDVPFGELRAGYVVVYRDPWNGGRGTTHALVRREAGGWVAKGLNNAGRDLALVSPRNYRGVVVGIIRDGIVEPISPLFVPEGFALR